MAAAELPLTISERDDGKVRLSLSGFSYADGETLQEAAEELVQRMLVIAHAFRNGGFGPVTSECGLDSSILDFVWQLGEVVSSGGDVRQFLFGRNSTD